MSNHPFFVVAPSYQWFVFWCRDRGINPKDKEKAIYIRDLRDIQGHVIVKEEQIVDLGLFDQKRYDLVLSLKNRVIKKK